MANKDFLDFIKIKKLDTEYPFKSVKHLFENAEIIFCNLECCLSKDGITMRPNTGPQLYSPPEEVISILRYLNCNVVSIGNNHIKDFGEGTIEYTRTILEKNGFYVFGAGRDLYEANKEIKIEKKGIRVSFLGYTTNTNKDGISPDIGACIATIDSAGCVYYDIEKIRQDIKRLRVHSDIICISLHWGYEDLVFPSPSQIKLAHQIIDAGANIIIGHHPHVVQGIESYKHGVIIYSVGNFFFLNRYNNPELPKEENMFIIVMCEVNKNQIKRYEIFPGCMDKNFRLNILEDKEKKEYLSKFAVLSNQIYRNDYKIFWEKYKENRKKFLNKLRVKAIIIQFFWKIKKIRIKQIFTKISCDKIRDNIKLFIKYLLRSL